MKFFAIFAAVCAVASASKGWTLVELSSAVSSPYTDAAIKPALEQALDYVMESIFTSDDYAPIAITTAAGVSGHYNLVQLESLLKPDINPVFLAPVEEAFNQLMTALHAGENIQTVPVMIPALDITFMSLSEIDNALSSPATNPALVPYLEYYLNQYMDALFSGQQLTGIAVAVPAGLGSIGGALPTPVVPAPVVPAPVVPAPVVPAPVVPAPVVPAPVVPAPVVPSPVAPETSASSPLVQIILNVQKSEDIAVGPTPSPAAVGSPVRPTPVQVVEQPEAIVSPVRPTPVQVVEQPEAIVSPIRPTPVQVVEQPIPVNPIDAIMLPVEALPIGQAPEPIVLTPY